jgi:uncharacterized protein DUF3108
VAAVCLVVVAFVASATEQPKPGTAAQPPAVPFRVGETLTYDVSWSSYLTAGTVVTTVQAKRTSFGPAAYYIVAEARPGALLSHVYTLYYKLDTFLDGDTLLSQRGSIYSEEGKRHRYKVTRFDRSAQRVFFEYQSGTTAKADFTVPGDTQDALSAVYALRTMPFHVGDQLRMQLSDDGDIYMLRVAVAARERVKTAFGDFDSWKLLPSITDQRGQAVGQQIRLWMSADARRLPVKMQTALAVGSFNLTLRDAR